MHALLNDLTKFIYSPIPQPYLKEYFKWSVNRLYDFDVHLFASKCVTIFAGKKILKKKKKNYINYRNSRGKISSVLYKENFSRICSTLYPLKLASCVYECKRNGLSNC